MAVSRSTDRNKCFGDMSKMHAYANEPVAQTVMSCLVPVWMLEELWNRKYGSPLRSLGGFTRIWQSGTCSAMLDALDGLHGRVQPYLPCGIDLGLMLEGRPILILLAQVSGLDGQKGVREKPTVHFSTPCHRSGLSFPCKR